MWCTLDPAMPNDKPFPFWLFSANSAEYVRGLLRYDKLEELPRRLAYVFQEKAERARRDGYWDYEPDYIGLGWELRACARGSNSQWATGAPPRPAAFRRREAEGSDPVHSVRYRPDSGLSADLSGSTPATGHAAGQV